jgi:hypothetical protein
MTDSFYIGAYWSSRAEPLTQVRDKVLQTFERLIVADEQFLNWYEGGVSRRKALEKRVTFNTETVERLCLQQVKKGELDNNGFAKMGFSFGLWTGHQEGESSSISFTVGSSFSSPHLCNSSVLRLPFEGAARGRLLESRKGKEILSILVDIWHPDYAVLTSQELNNRLNIVNDIGWITYRKSIACIPKTGDKVFHEKYDDGHMFYLVGNNCYNYDLINELMPLKKIIE